MKIAAITQRVEKVIEYNETRDCIDRDWYVFLKGIGYTPLIIPNFNSYHDIDYYLKKFKVDLLILTGGNTLSCVSPESYDVSRDRDMIENTLISYCIKFSIPIIGICRGMQILNIYFDGSVRRIDGHVGNSHKLKYDRYWRNYLPSYVNSFHVYGITMSDLSDSLKPLAWDVNNNIESFIHLNLSILGIMWHPEREIDIDYRLINYFLRTLK